MGLLDSVLGPVLGFIGGERANQERESAAYGQMHFQERMSSTAYQRAVQDMQSAGLNPMLAYSQGGASAPMGAMPQVENTAASAFQGSQISAMVDNLRAMNEKIAAETKNVESQTAVNLAQVPYLEQQTRTSVSSAANLEAQSKNILERLEKQMPEEVHKLISEAIRNFETTTNLNAQTRNLYETFALIKQQVKTERERTAVTRAEAELRALDIPKARNEAGVQEDWWKKNVSPYLGDLGAVTNSAGRLGLRR
jgi:hypothetical protein